MRDFRVKQFGFSEEGRMNAPAKRKSLFGTNVFELGEGELDSKCQYSALY
jgi:hypothetical protein